MTHPTAVCPPGMVLLGSVREVFELAGVIEAADNGDINFKMLDMSPQEKQVTVTNGLCNKKTTKNVPIPAENGYPEYDIGIRKALKKNMYPVVTVSAENGVGSHAMCAYRVDEATQEEMLFTEKCLIFDNFSTCIFSTIYNIIRLSSKTRKILVMKKELTLPMK